MEEKLDKFLAYLEENGVEISGETAFKCDDGIVLFSPNDGGGVDIAIIRNVIELNYSLGITDADVNLFNTEVGIMQVIDFLENTYTGAKMMGDEEVMLRASRALLAFKADVHKDIFIEENVLEF